MIYFQTVNSILKSVNIKEKSGISICFKNFTININDYHEQDCCEHVYVDWDEVEYSAFDPVIDKNVKAFSIKEVENMGILLCFTTDERDEIFNEPIIHKVLITAHNIQNGYYSSKLELIISSKVDISECVKDKMV